MHTRNGVSIAVFLWAAVMAIALRPVVTAQEAGGRKIWDGVYTEAQATRGKPAFETSCGRCHNNALVGSDRAPALKGDGFFSHWENDTLDKLFTKIRDTMPAGGIESVTDAGKLDILANSQNSAFHRQLDRTRSGWLFAAPVNVSDRNIEGHDTSPTTVDWHSDGKRDLVVGAEDGYFYYLPR